MRLAPLAILALAAALSALAAPRAAQAAPTLAFPLACEIGRTCEIQHYVDRDPGPGLLDYRCGHRVEDKHDGVDIRLLDMVAQRAGVDVLAAAPGRVIAIRDGVPDISIRAPGAPSTEGHHCGNRVAIALGDAWILDYCHLAEGSLKVRVGDTVGVGQPLAHVGLSGDTEFPHLHFSVRHANQVVDPFAPSSLEGCEAQAGSLWTPEAARQMTYKRGVVLNTGFAAALVGQGAIENRTTLPASPDAPALVAYARLIGLEQGDVIDMSILGPDGKVISKGALPPLNHDKDEFPAQLGHKRPAQGWARGVYLATLQVRRAGQVVISQRWQATL
ncbi:M23 family metallopeptidase [Phenylobacterium sp.]|uniref:M23 family metallopeptidase n=1 Tax=Phenylobacterium sp. TaxID=1871053 RepID=UPI0012157397|nr:M23 family metallopeptidase [Phenylobacterium sp.]THD58905.1 MAG: M23 family metallopeptidase [Phenylobacterium sp.]